MTPEAIKAHLIETGWQLSRRGDYTRTLTLTTPAGTSSREVRVVFNKYSIAIQMQMLTECRWLRIGGATFESVVMTPKGMRCITFFFPPKTA